MPTDSTNSQQGRFFPVCAQAALRAFRLAHRGMWRLLQLVIRTLVIAYFVFCSVFLGLRYGVLPNIGHYKPDVEQMASRALGQPVSIARIEVSWWRLTPRLALTDVVIHDALGTVALRLPKVSAALSWWSVAAGQIRLAALEIDRPDLDIERKADGRLYVAGIAMDSQKNSDSQGADWVLLQHQIVIRNGRLRWTDKLRNAAPLVLENVNLKLENGWQRHAFALTATPPAALAEPLDLRGIFYHHAFAHRVSDFTQWTGTLYAAVRSPALHAWSAYVDYPMTLHAGAGAVRAWLAFDHRQLADLTADVQLADVSAQFVPALPLLELVALTGRISIREEILPGRPAARAASFGAAGHTVSLSNFSLLTRDGLRLPSTSVSETFVPARLGQPEQVSLSAAFLDLKTLASLAVRMPVTPAQRRMLQDFAPTGTVADVSARWEGAYPDIGRYSLKGQFSHVSMPVQPARGKAGIGLAMPGFDNLSGSIEANNQGGAVTLDSTAVVLRVPGYFPKPSIDLDQLGLQARWSFQHKDALLLEVQTLQFAKDAVHGALAGQYLVPLDRAHSKSLGIIDMNGTFSGLDVARIDAYLPKITPVQLRSWLTGALVSGTLQDAHVQVKGELADFPFDPKMISSSVSKSPGEFKVAGQIVNGKLDVAPGMFAKEGKAPMWPLIEAIQGRISFDRTRMEIDARSARIHAVAVSAVTVVMPDILSPDLQLSVDGTASGALQELVGFVNDSPVLDWIGRFTEETRATGNAVLGLKLQLPLSRLLDSKVQGTLQLGANDVALQRAIPTLQQASGKLEFNEKGVAVNAIKANFVGGPVSVTGGSQRDGAIVIRADGSVTSEGLRHAFAAPAIQHLADHITGGTRYGVTIAVRKKRLEILVETSLQGVGLDFPAPLKKTASDILPLKFEVVDGVSDDGAGARDEIRIALGSALSARYLRHKGPEKNAPWHVVSGGIGVNVPAPQPERGVGINVSLKRLNIDAWRNLASSVTAVGTTAGEGHPAAQAGVTSDVSGLEQYLEPDVLSARATELIVAGKTLDNVVVGLSHQNHLWQANIDSVQASGYLSWDESATAPGSGRVTARLSSLTIPKTAAADVSDILESGTANTQFPALDIVAENFELYGKRLGRLELIAANKPGVAGIREWRIDKLSLLNPDAELKATGGWRSINSDSATNLSYRMTITNAGRLLERFGFANIIRGGKGVLDGDLSWNGMPFALDIPSLGGQMRIDMAAGQFLKVDPGAAKLLGVLSLQSLPRRLTLDFRDVFSEGFAFDSITGAMAIAQGTAITDNLKMRGVAATVVMSGSADIERETQNLHVAVIPEINVGAASVVYALAVNPVIGVGSFLAQLFLRDPLMRAFTFEYRITGPWTAPLVVKVDRNGTAFPVKPLGQFSSAG